MKMININLRNCIEENNLNHLMLIAIQSFDELSKHDLDCIVNVRNEKPSRIVV